MNNQDPSRGLFLQEEEEEEEENDNPQKRGGADSGIPSFSEMTGLFLQHAASSSFGCFSTTDTPSASAHHMYYNLMSASFELPSSTVPVQKMASPCTNREESSGAARKYEQFQESNVSSNQGSFKIFPFLFFSSFIIHDAFAMDSTIFRASSRNADSYSSSIPSPNSSASDASRLPMLGVSEALLIPTPNVLESLPLITSSCTNFEPFSGTSFPLQALTSPEDGS